MSYILNDKAVMYSQTTKTGKLTNNFVTDTTSHGPLKRIHPLKHTSWLSEGYHKDMKLLVIH